MALCEGFVWLDSALPAADSVSILTAFPTEILTGHLRRDWHLVAAALGKARHAVENIPPCPGDPAACPPAGGLYGWVGFDGQFVLGSYPHALLYDHGSGIWFESGQISSLVDWTKTAPSVIPPVLDFQPMVPRPDFLRQVNRAQEYISAGDIYQVNLSVPWRASWPPGAPFLPLYQNLRKVSPAPHAACLNLQGTTVLSASPELFLKISGRTIATRPIKGTRPRFAADPARDAASARELLASPKERAELLMITDLERNDLGQVCEFGSVAVPELWKVESFAQVYHLVSTVTGKLRPEISHAEAFRACFPGGSISGAPKRRALEIIEELEPHPRGHYTGAIGYFGFDGESQWNIAIRTAVQTGSGISFHVGSGIVADSIPEHEWDETLHKAAGVLAAAGGK
ncbi:MAG TPA: anthranilate synthase component I family protein [Prosthecobacter sp.]|nr:anthranilate synthase component I family protein [Prosthecobacter sp.]